MIPGGIKAERWIDERLGKKIRICLVMIKLEN